MEIHPSKNINLENEDNRLCKPCKELYQCGRSRRHFISRNTKHIGGAESNRMSIKQSVSVVARHCVEALVENTNNVETC